MRRLCLSLAVALVGLSGIAADAAGEAVVTRYGPASRSTPTVLTIHAGGWLITGPGAMAVMAPVVDRLRARGFSVYNIGYSAGTRSLDDVDEAVRLVEADRGSARLCLYGASAGGHLALLLASKRSEIDCVVAVASPLDLLTVGPYLVPAVSLVFGPDRDRLKRWSPLYRASRIKAPVLIEAGEDDSLVPIEQQRAFLRRRPQTRSVILSPGSVSWMHGTSSQESLDQALRTEARFLRRHTRR